MSGLVTLVKGFAGKPSHPPLTDASIGAYTVAVAMLVLGAFGVEEEQAAHGALLALGGGLALALPTALTGLLDWLAIPKATRARTLATIHLITMLSATAVFGLAFLTHLDGYRDGQVETLPLVLAIGAELLLVLGGYLGGALVFVYGVRVLKRSEAALTDALVPGRLDEPRPPSEEESSPLARRMMSPPRRS